MACDHFPELQLPRVVCLIAIRRQRKKIRQIIHTCVHGETDTM